MMRVNFGSNAHSLNNRGNRDQATPHHVVDRIDIMILPSFGAVFLFSFLMGAIFRKISSWVPGIPIALPMAYFLVQTNDNLRITQGIIYDFFSFFLSENVSDILLCFAIFAGGVGIWGVTSLGLAIGKRFGGYIAYRSTKGMGE